MKKIIGILTLSLLPFFGSAQDKVDFSKYGEATIDLNHCVHLDDSKAVEKFYVIDISHLGFESETEAYETFGLIANNLLTYSIYFEDQKAVLQVHLERTLKGQDIVWWNAYLLSLCNK